MPDKAKTDDFQPLTEVQAQQAREYVNKLTENRVNKWDVIPEGWENTWELRITPELVILYADGVEDYNPWYEAWGMYGGPKGESPFGPAITPPLLLSYKCNGFSITEKFKLAVAGGIHVSHNSQILEPIPIGTLVRFRGKLVSKFIKRGRRYHRVEVTVEDAETGKLLHRETREELCQYRKQEE